MSQLVIFPVDISMDMCGRLKGWGGGYFHAKFQSYDRRPSHPHDTGTEHVVLRPSRQTSRAPSTKRSEVFDLSRDWWAASY